MLTAFVAVSLGVLGFQLWNRAAGSPARSAGVARDSDRAAEAPTALRPAVPDRRVAAGGGGPPTTCQETLQASRHDEQQLLTQVLERGSPRALYDLGGPNTELQQFVSGLVLPQLDDLRARGLEDVQVECAGHACRISVLHGPGLSPSAWQTRLQGSDAFRRRRARFHTSGTLKPVAPSGAQRGLLLTELYVALGRQDADP
jgi:hypothetical protein